MTPLFLALLWWMGCRTAPPPAADPATHVDAAIDHYTCPMHPSIHAAAPGACPICGMDLVPVSKAEAESGEVILDAARRQALGVVTAPVTLAPLTRAVSGWGELGFDAGKTVDLSLRVMGQARGVRVASPGVYVQKGEVVFSLDSTDLLSAQRDLLASRGTTAEPAARLRLIRWGLDEATIDGVLQAGLALERVPVRAPASGIVIEKNVVEGATVGPDMPPLRIAPLDPVWVEIRVPLADAEALQVGQTATVTLPGGPVQAAVTWLSATVDTDTRTRAARLSLANPEGVLLPGTPVTATVDVPLGEVLQIPRDAVIYTGSAHLVFVDRGEGRLEPRPVEIGSHDDHQTIILSGLSVGEQVVRSGTFLVAAESRIRGSGRIWGAHDAH